MDFYEINDITGFANGDLFENDIDVRKYFTIENMKSMFSDGFDENKITQEELEQMAETVIKNRWHIK
ncbi:hypothetical protein LCGC14_0999830 [marine sediment metagenome]|uniref:Uncharacterized protein n=1 Tax=marine sediment metagenome TaxID=412755 RepID=A0A0F9R9J1_9ZZZZ|nr:MAG: hypothetical protein Lokiarch_05970 [Candidatus Lokiarchaeum sp. GC14_75]